jgi:hypothetical protein
VDDIRRWMEEARKAEAERILDLWAAGELTETQIGGTVGRSRNYVHKVVVRARRAGDPRAAPRDRAEAVRRGNRRANVRRWEQRAEIVRRRALVAKRDIVTIAELLEVVRKHMADK